MHFKKSILTTLSIILFFTLTACSNRLIDNKNPVLENQTLIENENKSKKIEATFSTMDVLKDYLADMDKVENFDPYYQIAFAFDKLPNGVSSVPIEKVKSLYNELKTTFDYVLIWQSPLRYKGYYSGNTDFVDGYDQYLKDKNNPQNRIPINITAKDSNGNKSWITPLKTVMIGEGIFDRFNNYIDKGRNLNASDFILEKSDLPISIVLGSEYNGIYELGEILSLELISEAMNFQVVGFYKPGVHFSMGVGALQEVKFDNAIVVPFFMPDYEPIGETAIFQHAMLFAELTSGCIPITDPVAEINDDTFNNHLEKMHQLTQKHGVEELYLYPYRPVGFIWNENKQ